MLPRAGAGRGARLVRMANQDFDPASFTTYDPEPGGSCLQGRRDPRGYVAIAITAAPAQDVSRVFTAPTGNHFRCHLKLVAVFVAFSNQRTEVVDKLCGSVVSDMCRSGERLVINCPALGDLPAHPRRGDPFPSPNLNKNTRNISGPPPFANPNLVHFP